MAGALEGGVAGPGRARKGPGQGRAFLGRRPGDYTPPSFPFCSAYQRLSRASTCS